MTGLFLRRLTAGDIDALLNAGDLQELARLLNHPDRGVRERAIDALGASGRRALPLLVRALRSSSVRVRLGALGALGIIRDPGTVPPLADRAGTDPNTEVRWAAILTLGEIGDASAVPVCLAALEDRNRYIRYGAAVTLGNLFWEPADDEAWARYFIALQDWEGLRSLGPSAAGPMRTMLKDDDPGVRMKLIELLSRTGTPQAVEGCTELLKDRRDPVRFTAVLSALRSGLTANRLPLIMAWRERTGPDPLAAAILDFLFPGIGSNYIGRWWGFLLFMCFMSVLVLAQLRMGPFVPYLLAYPFTALFAVQTYREAKRRAAL